MPYLEQCLLGVSHETLYPTLRSACLDYLCSSPVADFNVEFQYLFFFFFLYFIVCVLSLALGIQPFIDYYTTCAELTFVCSSCGSDSDYSVIPYSV